MIYRLLPLCMFYAISFASHSPGFKEKMALLHHKAIATGLLQAQLLRC